MTQLNATIRTDMIRRFPESEKLAVEIASNIAKLTPTDFCIYEAIRLSDFFVASISSLDIFSIVSPVFVNRSRFKSIKESGHFSESHSRTFSNAVY